ncbi:MAG: hypothetical protein IPM29_26590 [Planctomycetes bacterium]|nr:hypothetical protein [Planctomycetota bacterium]
MEGALEPFELRTTVRREPDFLFVHGDTLRLPVEVEPPDTRPAPSWRAFAGVRPCRRAIQVARRPTFERHAFGDTELAVVGAAEFLSHLV